MNSAIILLRLMLRIDSHSCTTIDTHDLLVPVSCMMTGIIIIISMMYGSYIPFRIAILILA